MLSLETSTHSSYLESDGRCVNFDSSIRLGGVCVCHLTRACTINATLWAIWPNGKVSPVAAGCVFAFSKHNRLKAGKQRLVLHPGRVAQPQMVPTPQRSTEIRRLEKAERKFLRGQMPSVPWLDSLSQAHIHSIEAHEEEAVVQHGLLELLVELPLFDYPVIFSTPSSSQVSALYVFLVPFFLIFFFPFPPGLKGSHHLLSFPCMHTSSKHVCN